MDKDKEKEAKLLQKKLAKLVKMGRKKKYILDVAEVEAEFVDLKLTKKQMEKVYQYLASKDIDVLRIGSGGKETDREMKQIEKMKGCYWLL